LSGGSGNYEKFVKRLPLSGIRNRNGIGEISKSDIRNRKRKRDWNE
jgi:hypothetical protein